MTQILATTPEKIHHEIEYMLKNGIPYIEALVEYSEKHDIDIETVAETVKKSVILLEKIKKEAIGLRMVSNDNGNTDITSFIE